MKKYLRADFREDHKAALARGKAKKAEWAGNVLRQIRESEDPIQDAFDLLVPSSGKANTLAGELIRAIMKIMYRDFNDGDVFYEGYGIETCGDAVAFLCDKLPYIENDFEAIAMRCLQGKQYTDAIKDIADKIIEDIIEDPEYINTKNTEDMYDYDGEAFIEDHEWEPVYEFDCSIPDNVQYHIDKGDISSTDFIWELESWEYLNDADIENNGDYIYIRNLNKDAYDEVEPNMYAWLEQYGEDLDSEFGSEDDEY